MRPGVGRGSKRRYLGKGSPTTNRYFCVSKLPQSPTETKPERKNAQTDKVEVFRLWSCSRGGGGGGGGGGTRQGGENRWGFVWLRFWGRSISGILSRSALHSLWGGSVYGVETCCRLSVGWQTSRTERRKAEERGEKYEEDSQSWNISKKRTQMRLDKSFMIPEGRLGWPNSSSSRELDTDKTWEKSKQSAEDNTTCTNNNKHYENRACATKDPHNNTNMKPEIMWPRDGK